MKNLDNEITNFAGRESGCKSVIHQLEDWHFVVIIPPQQGDTPSERRVITGKSVVSRCFYDSIACLLLKKKSRQQSIRLCTLAISVYISSSTQYHKKNSFKQMWTTTCPLVCTANVGWLECHFHCWERAKARSRLSPKKLQKIRKLEWPTRTNHEARSLIKWQKFASFVTLP